MDELFRESVVIGIDANQGHDLFNLDKFIDATAKVHLELLDQLLPIGTENSLFP